jgi:hypothetical protein
MKYKIAKIKKKKKDQGDLLGNFWELAVLSRQLAVNDPTP